MENQQQSQDPNNNPGNNPPPPAANQGNPPAGNNPSEKPKPSPKPKATPAAKSTPSATPQGPVETPVQNTAVTPEKPVEIRKRLFQVDKTGKEIEGTSNVQVFSEADWQRLTSRQPGSKKTQLGAIGLHYESVDEEA